MRKLIMLILLAVVNCGAAAEWVKVGATDKFNIYADPTTIRKARNLTKMWHIFDHKQAVIVEGIRYLSEKAQYEYDCKNERVRSLFWSYHAGGMGGAVLPKSSENL